MRLIIYVLLVSSLVSCNGIIKNNDKVRKAVIPTSNDLDTIQVELEEITSIV